MQCLVCQSQVAETFRVGLLESQRIVFGKVQPLSRKGKPLGIRESVLDGQTHIGHAQLGFYRSVLELHHRVDDRLGMYYYLNLFGAHAEEPFGFDYFEALVHHRSRVDGYLGSHVPVGMMQSLRLGDRAELVDGVRAERATRRGKNHLRYRIVHLQALENSRVFRVYRKNRGMIFLCQSIDNLTRYDHGFLIGKGDGLSRTDGIHCRQQTGIAHHSG